MTKFLLRLSLCAAALAAVTTTVANAADYEPPPPPLRGSWTGPYVGAFVMGVGVESHYDSQCDNPADCDFDPEMSGITWGGGLLAGFNFEVSDSFVLGIEGDYGWAGGIDNDDPIEATEMDIDDIATLRARAGFLSDDTLFYATGGVAFVKTTFGGDVGDPNDPNRPFIDDTQWTTGWTIGGGIEHAFTDFLHARLEYLYLGLPDEEYDLEVGTVDLDFEDVHLIRAGVTLNFGNFF